MNFFLNPTRLISVSVAMITVSSVVSGCATVKKAPAEPVALSPYNAHEMSFVSSDNTSVSWEQLVDRATQADVIVLGEQHDDLEAHIFQAELVRSVLKDSPLAVCMEMFERDEQALVDAYLAGSLSQKTLVDVTDSRDWSSPGQWDTFYQPIVDAAKNANAPVVAANAPRRFARLGRFEGFEKLSGLASAYPGQYVVPRSIEETAYSERFKATMSHHGAPAAKGTQSSMATAHALTPEQVDGMFRAQQVWDATMADAVVNAWRVHGKAALIVGQFHTDFDGGLLLRMKAAAPDAKFLTISVQRVDARMLRVEDQGRADIVAYHPSTSKQE